jgi:hypothetical protein
VRCGDRSGCRSSGRRLASAAALAAASATILGAASASAAIFYVGGTGITVYGVAPYGLPVDNGLPTFISNNVTGFNDVLSSPAGGFLTASPIAANNISQFGLAGLPLASFHIGGANGVGAFGAGAVAITGPRVGFTLADSGPGGGEASYSISSWSTNLVVGPGGFAGNLGTYLAVGGTLPFGGASADVASLVSNYYENNVYVGQTTPLVLSAAGNGNFTALGGSGAALIYGPGLKSFRGLAIDNLPAVLGAGTTIKVVSTLTVYADPASIDSIFPDSELILDAGAGLPTGILADVSGGVPEPSTWVLALVGFGLMGWRLRSQAARAA